MGIEAIAVPSRSRLFTEQDAREAYELLTGLPVYVTDDEGSPVLDDEGNPTPLLDDEGNPTREEPQAAKFGTYDLEDPKDKAERDKVESKARTQGMSLDRLIASLYGRRFGVSVWVNQDGKVVGALVPREPVQRKAKDEDGNGEDTPLSELRGHALDEALEARGLSKNGKLAEKQARLADAE